MGARLDESRIQRERRARARQLQGNADAQLAGRYWLTALAARHLGHPVPADVPDGQAVTFTSKGS